MWFQVIVILGLFQFILCSEFEEADKIIQKQSDLKHLKLADKQISVDVRLQEDGLKGFYEFKEEIARGSYSLNFEPASQLCSIRERSLYFGVVQKQQIPAKKILDTLVINSTLVYALGQMEGKKLGVFKLELFKQKDAIVQKFDTR